MAKYLDRVLAGALAAGAMLLASRVLAAVELKQPCDFPAGDAPATLRVFSERSGREVLFAAEVVRGVHTNAVRGEFTPREALERMLAGTDLVAVPDERSSAFAVSRRG